MRSRTEYSSFKVVINIAVTIITSLCLFLLASILYAVFNNSMISNTEVSSENMLMQSGFIVEDYLKDMRMISDNLCNNAIDTINLKEESLDGALNLVYESNKENLVSIACFDNEGNLIASAPSSRRTKDISINEQQWFNAALADPHNIHFSTPHVQNIFDLGAYRYYWVLSSSRNITLHDGKQKKTGVLLIDMNYSKIQEIIEEMNESNVFGYTYLADREGNLIYHPKSSLINANLYVEDNEETARLKDGSHRVKFLKEDRLEIVKTISYTGWKIINVIPISELSVTMKNTRYLVAFFALLVFLLVVLLNSIISRYLFRPLETLADSVAQLDVNDPESIVSVDGSEDVRYLGMKMNDLIERLRRANETIVIEQEEKRKAELDALQSQINPHFLYNTLDSIIWMIEGEYYTEAITMIKNLASLFRISLSEGKTIITIEKEIAHAENYMNIQKYRYRNKFDIVFDISEEILQCKTVKLIVQPLLENSLYHAMEFMDGDGDILVKGYRDGDDVYIKVTDNGMGMTQETIDKLLDESAHDAGQSRKKGSGVGLINVDKRIKIRFGQEYGLSIESQPDEGTTVIIHLPYQLFTGE